MRFLREMLVEVRGDLSANAGGDALPTQVLLMIQDGNDHRRGR